MPKDMRQLMQQAQQMQEQLQQAQAELAEKTYEGSAGGGVVKAVVSKHEVVEHVWGEEGDVDENTVEVYIRRLRKKVDEPFGARLIKTVRGVGYQLDEAG